MAQLPKLVDTQTHSLFPSPGPGPISTSGAERPRADASNVRKRIKSESATRSLLRSVGLKAVSASTWLKQAKPKARSEQKKIVVTTSQRIALTRITVHILPVTITIFLIAFNAVELLNSPNITTVATFFLQVAAKFHVSEHSPDSYR